MQAACLSKNLKHAEIKALILQNDSLLIHRLSLIRLAIFVIPPFVGLHSLTIAQALIQLNH